MDEKLYCTACGKEAARDEKGFPFHEDDKSALCAGAAALPEAEAKQDRELEESVFQPTPDDTPESAGDPPIKTPVEQPQSSGKESD